MNVGFNQHKVYLFIQKVFRSNSEMEPILVEISISIYSFQDFDEELHLKKQHSQKQHKKLMNEKTKSFAKKWQI